jgi:hypothetical protein
MVVFWQELFLKTNKKISEKQKVFRFRGSFFFFRKTPRQQPSPPFVRPIVFGY